MADYERTLTKQRIPVNVVGGQGFFTLKEVQDVLSLLNYANCPGSTYDLNRIAKNFKLGIGEKLQLQVYENQRLFCITHQNILDLLLALKGGAAKRATGWIELQRIVLKVPTNNVHATLTFLDSALGICKILEAQDIKDPKKFNLRTESFDTLLVQAQQTTKDIQGFLDDIMLLANNEDEHDNAVTVSTIHGFKGLESKYVFIPDLNEGILPHAMAVSEDDKQQEFNAYFVAKTRAKRGLFLTRSLTKPDPRTRGGQLSTQRSSFINKELKQLMKLGVVQTSEKGNS